MCATCGCSDNSRPRLTDLETGRAVPLDEPAEPPRAEHSRHDHGHDHPRVGTTISIETAVLAKNDRLAALNRGWLARRAILALNLVSSPGSGKTTLL
ncbi:MAG: hydrogenase accessory protein HypB, partial [Planctomycetota bacterium]|nr:hydrogenase accessory protein HypB [Planctomycetota bacterium]